jgi:hypothetical protein
MCAVYRTLSLLLRGGLSVSGASSGTTSGSTSSGGSAATGADVQEQVLDILALKSLSTIRNLYSALSFNRSCAPWRTELSR